MAEHTPIVGQLCLRVDTGNVGFRFDPLPTKLDKLFRASPALADALRKMKDTHGMHGPCNQHSCSSCQMAYKRTCDALALLED